jgi:hypothetical protein
MHVPQNNGVDRVKVETVKYSKKKTHKFIKQRTYWNVCITVTNRTYWNVCIILLHELLYKQLICLIVLF